jgi:hypothetical protein
LTRDEWTGVRIPVALAKKIDQFLKREEAKSSGMFSRSDLVTRVVSDWLASFYIVGREPEADEDAEFYVRSVGLEAFKKERKSKQTKRDIFEEQRQDILNEINPYNRTRWSQDDRDRLAETIRTYPNKEIQEVLKKKTFSPEEMVKMIESFVKGQYYNDENAIGFIERILDRGHGKEEEPLKREQGQKQEQKQK